MVWAKEMTGLLKKRRRGRTYKHKVYTFRHAFNIIIHLSLIYSYIYIKELPFSYFFLASLAFSVVAAGL